MNKILTSLDWQQVQAQIEQPARQLKQYSYEMLRISKNIGLMVTELSKEEITCRRLHKRTMKHIELVDKINEEIANYERQITFGLMLL